MFSLVGELLTDDEVLMFSDELAAVVQTIPKRRTVPVLYDETLSYMSNSVTKDHFAQLLELTVSLD